MPITDLEVGPDGNIYFTTGGNAGQGGLYKVTWTGAKPVQPDMTGILGVVRQPQPLSSWGWEAIERVKASMGASFAGELEKLARTATAASADRSRAILEMQRHGVPPSPELLKALISDKDANVRAAAVLAAGVQTSDGAKAVAAAALKDASPVVKRRAAEALVRQGLKPTQPSFAPVADIYALLGNPDRFVRYSGRLALEHTPRTEWHKLVMAETDVIALTEGLVALTNTMAPQAEAELRPIFDKLIALMKQPSLPAAQKIRVLRAFEIAATETRNGVDPEIRKQVYDALIGQFPVAPPAGTWIDCNNGVATTGCAQLMLTHHLAKVLAYTGEPAVIGKILAVIPRGDADQPGQIDYVYALRVLDKGWTPAQVKTMTEWFAKASTWRGGSTFAGHVNQIFDAVIDAFSEEQKQAAYAAVPLFAPLPADPPAAATPPTAATPPVAVAAPPTGATPPPPPPPTAAGPGAQRGAGPAGGWRRRSWPWSEQPARPSGALRQPGVPARRRARIAHRTRRRSQRRNRRQGVPGLLRVVPQVPVRRQRLRSRAHDDWRAAASRHPPVDLLPAGKGRREVRDHRHRDPRQQDAPRPRRERGRHQCAAEDRRQRRSCDCRESGHSQAHPRTGVDHAGTADRQDGRRRQHLARRRVSHGWKVSTGTTEYDGYVRY